MSLPGLCVMKSQPHERGTTTASTVRTSPRQPHSRPARIRTPSPASSARLHRERDEFHKLLDGVVIDESGLFVERLQAWEDFYNFDRPHEGLGGQTPYEKLRQKTGTPV